MGLTKTEAFTRRQNQVADYAKALAHPARVAILEHLIRKDVCICSDLVVALPLAQATVSQHLAELKKVGLIRGTITGTSMCYCLDKDEWQTCIALLEDLFGRVKSVTQCC